MGLTRLEGRGLDVDPATRHRLHDPSESWSETNCYTDIWIQLLHRLGLDPVPAMSFVLATRFEGEQWTFAKPPIEDLYRLHGIRIVELYVWRPLPEHVQHAAGRGDLLTIEVDAHWLPDTAATTYRTGHEKTTIVPVELDRERGWMRYLHNSGCFEVDGEDFTQLFPADPERTGLPLPPYTELISLAELRTESPSPAVVRDLVGEHLRRRPPGNPVADLAERLVADLPSLAAAGVEEFHLYAFATARQCGAVATLGKAVAEHLAGHGDDVVAAATAFGQVAEGAKTVQFLLARAARGRQVDVAAPLDAMTTAWATAMELMSRHYAG